jgi:hypothetical protein
MNLRTAIIVAITAVAPIPMRAQSPTVIPVPSQLATAKTVFVGYAGTQIIATGAQAGPSAYDDVQRELAASGRYTITSKPADAELSLRISIEADSDIRLTAFDTKTGMILWTFDEELLNSSAKNVNNAAIKLVHDLEAVATRVPSTIAKEKK